MERVGRPRRAETLLTAGVVLLVVVAVAAIGAVHPATQVALSAGALALFCAYAFIRGRSGFRAVPFALVAAVGLAATVAQLVPLPAALVGLLSPAAHQLRVDSGAGRFFPLTVDVPATLLALARGAACTGLLVVVGSLVRSARHARRLLFIPATVGAGLAVIAVVQRLAGVHTILGFYAPRSLPGVGIFGTFVDVNHAASVLSLGLFAAIGVALDSERRQRELAIACAVACGVGLLFTTSRGGIFAAGVGGYVLLLALIVRRFGLARGVVGATVLAVVLAGGLLATHNELRAKVSSPAVYANTQKTRGWADAFRMAGAYAWTGVGRGAFAAPIGSYRRDDEGVRLVYPENAIAQLASEWGWPVALLILGLLGVTVARLFRPLGKMPAAIVAAACGVLAVLVHELFDFGLEFPGVAFPTVVTLAIVVGATRREEEALSQHALRLTPPRLVPLAAGWALSLVGAVWAVGHTLDADWNRLHAAEQHDAVDDKAIDEAIRRHPADDYLELLAARAALRHEPSQAMRHLNRALMLHPANWQAHRLAARLLIATHHPAQAALEYRLASKDGMIVALPELVTLLGPHVIETVEPTPAALDLLAQQLYGMNRPIEADSAARRAIDVASDREEALRARVQFAVRYENRAVLPAAAKTLAAEASTAPSFGEAALGLAHAQDRAGVVAVLAAGAKALPGDPALVLDGAQAFLDVGEPLAARQRLEKNARASFTLPQRQRAEELLALAAERLGDPDTAVIARTRARLIARQLRDMNLSP